MLIGGLLKWSKTVFDLDVSLQHFQLNKRKCNNKWNQQISFLTRSLQRFIHGLFLAPQLTFPGVCSWSWPFQATFPRHSCWPAYGWVWPVWGSSGRLEGGRRETPTLPLVASPATTASPPRLQLPSDSLATAWASSE